MNQESVQEESHHSALKTKLLAGAIIGLGVGLIGLFQGLQSGIKPFSWLVMGLFILASIAIGTLMLIMIFRVFNSGWTPIRRCQQEHVLSAFPCLAACFLPLLLVAWFGSDQSGILWSWVNPESSTIEVTTAITVSEDVLLSKKESRILKS